MDETAREPASKLLHSSSEGDTRAFGARLGRLLRGGEIIALMGELGAGKTCLVRGLAEGLGIAADKVRSPTFTLIAEYSGGRLPLYHVDLFRAQPTDVDRLALREYLYGDGVCVVEWFERLCECPPRLEVRLTFVGTNQRDLVVSAHGEGYDTLLRDAIGGS
jgi:tRNA threonylcarbamoyladenosine biosynthesis protein TsaE